MSKQLSDEITRLKESLAAVQRSMRTQRAQGLIAEATRNLPAGTAAHVRKLVEADVRRFVEQEGDVEAPLATEPAGDVAPVAPDAQEGDAPTVELPPDAGALPEEAQVIFLETYVAHIADGEEMATHKAWASVAAAGWVKDEATSEWAKVEPEIIAELVADEFGGEAETAPEGETVTEEALRKTIAAAVKSEKEYLARVSGAGRITGMGSRPGSEADTGKQLEEAFSGLLTPTQAKIAAAGRRNRR